MLGEDQLPLLAWVLARRDARFMGLAWLGLQIESGLWGEVPTPQAERAMKVIRQGVCQRGHSLDNAYEWRGERQCRECRKEWKNARRQKAALASS